MVLYLFCCETRNGQKIEMRCLLEQHPLILLEAAITEPLRRAENIMLHPDLSVSNLIYDGNGSRQLARLYKAHMQVAIEVHLPFVMLAPTWRANHERVTQSGVSENINRDCVQFMQTLRDNQLERNNRAMIRIGGLIGPGNDCYLPEQALSVAASREFHTWQIEQLAATGVDFLIAETLPSVNEALGIALAMSSTDQPYIISFVINREGKVLDGTDLGSAFDRIDSATRNPPLGYMINCSYPTFLHVATAPAAVFRRLIGFQANGSSLNHQDLEGAQMLQAEDVSDWGREMLKLNETYGIQILGGCCGTGVEHLRYIARNSNR
jgi:S-methylmethionine-dependent homocysteine/selenocysteine methylase